MKKKKETPPKPEVVDRAVSEMARAASGCRPPGVGVLLLAFPLGGPKGFTIHAATSVDSADAREVARLYGGNEGRLQSRWSEDVEMPDHGPPSSRNVQIARMFADEAVARDGYNRLRLGEGKDSPSMDCSVGKVAEVIYRLLHGADLEAIWPGQSAEVEAFLRERSLERGVAAGEGWPDDDLPAPVRVPDQPPPDHNESRPVWEWLVDEAPAMLDREWHRSPDELAVLVPDLLEDMRERDMLGRARYGTPLQLDNGRKALLDAYQEALDLCAYLGQAFLEHDRLGNVDEANSSKNMLHVALLLLADLKRQMNREYGHAA